jgi:hypothetical protein
LILIHPVPKVPQVILSLVRFLILLLTSMEFHLSFLTMVLHQFQFIIPLMFDLRPNLLFLNSEIHTYCYLTVHLIVIITVRLIILIFLLPSSPIQTYGLN